MPKSVFRKDAATRCRAGQLLDSGLASPSRTEAGQIPTLTVSQNKNMATVDRDTRARAFKAIRKRREQYGPTLFNPHYEIKGRAVQDRNLSHVVGPKLKTLQWEATGRRPLK